MTDLTDLTVTALSAGLARKRFSSRDVVDACLARIDALEPKLSAFVDVYAQDARLAAEAADKARQSGHGLGALHGIPIALKDLVEIEGRIATGGSAVWRDRLCTRTATLARKLTGAGMITIGKTHTVEFAYGGWGTNQHLGTPWNPWDATTHRTPGGSSSGSGVAVAARMVPCAIGTDTGGSVRLPASWCGITGLKVTLGRISTHGVLPLSGSLDTPGPMARGVEDCAVLLRVLQGADPADPHTLVLQDTDPMPNLRRGVQGLRLARLPDSERADVDAEVLAAYDRSLAQLADLGAEIVDITLPFGLRDIGNRVAEIISSEAYALVGDIADNNALPVDEAIRPRVRAGVAVSAATYLRALAEKERTAAATHALMADIDAMLLPTTLTPAIPVAAVDQSTTPAFLTRWVNYVGMCGVALPNGLTRDGLPTSLQIVCPGGAEAMALRIAWTWEQATDWHRTVPPMVRQAAGG
ncbi:amidase [Rhodopila sp.]|uniref:amidase n=1 Tax=Rhodopila sp. TaxID=2480087 RepID=UPI002BDB1371|nr:amidase [Rhodopila sp.]HVZ10061.1 amidase [Rhodopila sp.]